jgi:hypothetical protein
MNDKKLRKLRVEAQYVANLASPSGYKSTRWYEIYNKAFAELIYQAGWQDAMEEVKLKEKNAVDGYDPHVGCVNWPNCETEGCGP